MEPFNLWAGACSHVSKDLDRGDRESLVEAFRQSESDVDGAPGFDWDVFLHLGDTAASQTPPDAAEGREVRRQLNAARNHRREDIYNVVGNHDGTGPVVSGSDREVQWWFRTWIDPLGERPETSGVNAEARPYPISGTWERYAFEVGNVRFLMMGDRNDGGPPAGRAYAEEAGGYPAGRVTRETFEWWRDQVESHQDMIIVTAHHHMLRDTTVASGAWEGIMGNYHGYMADGAPEGAGCLYFVGDTPDDAFERYLEANPGSIDLWLGGHTHAPPDDRYGGKTHVEREWDVTFVNVAPLTKYHVQRKAYPMSRLFTFHPDRALADLRCYLHTDDFTPIGWYEDGYRRVPLRHRFEW